jgi:gliding motility-associated-like protein
VNFIDISGETYKDVTWDFGTGTNSSKDMGTTTFTYQKEGDYTVTYSVENMNGCKSENVKVNLIHVKSPPKAMISSDRNLINIYENVVRFDSKLSQNATFYKWDFGDNSSISNEQLVNHKYDPNTPGKFKVYLIVSNSPTNMICSDTAITWIDFPEEVIYYIPNTFTPNGDEFNNTFQPIFSSGYDPQNYSFIIFDRWGQIVFESKNPTVGWDGTFGDKLLGNDTFVWKLGFKEKANDNEHYTTGHVNLVK